jgi:isopentenyl diphosphate isomerase/L-lactate dehydrogenase-like FMN-dependent dehydrogenase
MDGVVVSHHGGRQVAGSVVAADALPRVAQAVGDRLTVLFDSGIRTGDDIFKALALGARAVLVGRPYVYGLGLDGRAGVEHVIRCLLAELDVTLALSGHATPGSIGPFDLVEDLA